MDTERFDALARSFTAARSRRSVTHGLVGLSLSGMLVSLFGLTDTEAKKKKKKGKGKKKKGEKPVSTCVDGIRNGSETDLDCGGGCPRCANFKGCFNRNDCASGFCDSNVCQVCASDPDCSADANGPCFCRRIGPAAGGPRVCHTRVPTGPPVLECELCPSGTHCISTGGAPEIFFCSKPCGAA